MNVISLFNGMGTLRQALHDLQIPVEKYYSSEIKPYAIKLQQHHFPDVIQVGDITKWKEWDINWKTIDFIGSGSPCQDLSNGGIIKRTGLNGNRSSLFFVFVDILNHVRNLNPNVKFLQENVGSADKLDIGIMSRAIGIYPTKIDSKLVTSQLRDRYYWTNIITKNNMFDIETDIPQPKDLRIKFSDILESGTTQREKCKCITEREYKNIYRDMTKFKLYIERKRKIGIEIVHVEEGSKVRNLTKTEFCRLQGFPDNYCDILSIQKTISLLGDGWTLPIIIHILSFIK